jgi:hypothetical protein
VKKCNPTASELTPLQEASSEAQRLSISAALKKFQVSSFKFQVGGKVKQVEKCNPTANELTLLQKVSLGAQRLRVSEAFKKFQVSSLKFQVGGKVEKWKSVILLLVN